MNIKVNESEKGKNSKFPALYCDKDGYDGRIWIVLGYSDNINNSYKAVFINPDTNDIIYYGNTVNIVPFNGSITFSS